MATATKMLERRREGLLLEETDDPDLLEAIEEMGAEAYASAVDVEARILNGCLRSLPPAGQEDPKGRAVLHYLDQEGWLELGCIIFSQYYDTARWVGELISETAPDRAGSRLRRGRKVRRPSGRESGGRLIGRTSRRG